MNHETFLAYCHACGSAMDVTTVPPFTNCACPACGQHTRVKREFGPYTLMKRHAEGGMSMVFSAHDNTLDREVAIKIINETYSSDERRISAFEREAKLTASLSHPHIVKVLTTGRAFGSFYIAMEFVSGGHLEHQIRNREKIPEEEMLTLGIEIAEGLQAAHASGLLHRDIKPGNILTDSEGHAKLVDFGLSLVTQGGKATAEEIWATPYYAPPETIEGAEEDLRSDIYAFGATLYHAMAGVPPCVETTMAIEKLRHAKQHVKPLREVDPTISPQTAKVVDKAMSFLPQDRYQSYEELIAALHRALGYATLGHHASTDHAEQRKQVLAHKRKRQQWVALGVGCCIALSAFVVVRISKPTVATPPTTASPPQAYTPPPPPDHAAEDLAREYRNARNALTHQNYLDSSEIFDRLLKNPKFQEPSRTMAGIEAMLTAYLDGRPEVAGQYGTTLRAHLRNHPPAASALTSSLSDIILRLDSFPPMPVPPSTSPAGAQDVLASLFAGLKNWQQGMLDHASKCFQQATSIALPPEGEWALFYQERARDYLHDYELLTSPLFASLPPSRERCLEACQQLDHLLPQLKTRGRAPFNVKAWRIDIIRHSSVLGTPPPQASPTQPPLNVDALATIQDEIESYRFLELVDFLEQSTSDPSGIHKPTLALVAQEAAGFIQDLQQDLSQRKSLISAKLPSGNQATALWIGADGHLLAQTSTGEERISWHDLSADTLISVHRLVVGSGDAEALRRHQRAIWFDWLAGNRQRARQAAAKISENDPDFAARWRESLQQLPGLGGT
jgi:eukaryotic-like serine/threonine-protein kinase